MYGKLDLTCFGCEKGEEEEAEERQRAEQVLDIGHTALLTHFRWTFYVLFCSAWFGSVLSWQSCCMHVAPYKHTHTYGHTRWFFSSSSSNTTCWTLFVCKTNQLQVLWFLLDAHSATQRFVLFFVVVALFTSSFVANGSKRISWCSTIFAIKNLQLDLSVLCARCVDVRETSTTLIIQRRIGELADAHAHTHTTPHISTRQQRSTFVSKPNGDDYFVRACELLRALAWTKEKRRRRRG